MRNQPATDNNVLRALSNLVTRYCKKANRADKRALKIVASIIGMVLSLYVWIGAAWGGGYWIAIPVVVFVVSGFSLVIQLQMVEREQNLRHSGMCIPDELLAMIAADPNLHEGFKVAIARALREGHQVACRDMYEHARDLTTFLAGREASDAPGSKALQSLLDLRDPRYWGFADDEQFLVRRGTLVGTKTANLNEVIDFIEASGVDLDAKIGDVSRIIAGQPFEVDGAIMQFVRQ